MAEVKINNTQTRERNLKKEFILIGESKTGMALTPKMIEQLYHEYDELFEFFELKDIKYTIVSDSYSKTVIFNPLRNIDKLAIKGILSL